MKNKEYTNTPKNNKWGSKKFKLIILAIFTVSLSAFAQDDSRNEIRIGPKVGFNKANIYDESNEDFVADPKYGWAAGGFLSIPIGTYLGFHPEVMFSQKGFKGEGTFLGNEYKLERTTNYLDVPLLLAFKPTKNITLLAGPQFSYLLSREDKFTGFGINVADEQEFENDNLKKNMMGGAFGLDVNINNLIIGGRVSWDMQDNHGDGNSSTPNYKNMVLQATVGLAF